jgi:2-haloacid dehalogenase
MPTNRREFLTIAASGTASGLVAATSPMRAATRPGIRAIAFDAFPILDPRPISALAEELFPGKGGELMVAWRTRQFEYTWLRTLSGTYTDFLHVTEDALVFAVRSLKLDLPAATRERLVHSHLELKAWPDVRPALIALREAGLRMAFLSNFTVPMLNAGIRNSGLEGLLETPLSTDQVRAFKPDPRAYQMALHAFGVGRSEILFAAFAGWDAAGAKAFGFPTFWVSRLSQPTEELGAMPDATGAGLSDLVSFVTSAR